jgi:hypothetical protein
MTDFDITDHTRVRRLPERGHYDRETIHAILDGALVCHVGFVEEGRPVVIPTLHARDGDTLLLHGATSSRLLRHIGAGHETCVTATLLDGLVLARSIFHHSVNYRAVVLFGRGRLLETDAEKLAALHRFTERMMPGRWQDARAPNPQELKATAVAAIPIAQVSAKIRTGPPQDEDEDLDLPVWAGVLPLALLPGAPVPDQPAGDGPPIPGYLREWMARSGKPGSQG